MAQTYLSIVNEVLQDTNEVPLTALNFTAARGFHIFVKNAVNRALMDIVNESEEWNWLANAPLNPQLSMHSNQINSVRRTAVYTFPEEYSAVDWDSFVLEDLQTKRSYPLSSIQLEVWKRYRSSDAYLSRDEKDLARPEFIIRTPDQQGFQLSTVPDKQYRIRYNTWKAPTFLVNATDPLPFPDRFYNVLILRATYYAWKFRENKDQAGMTRGDYIKEIAHMKRILCRPAFQRMRAV